MLPSSNSLATLAHLTLSPFSHLTNTTLSLLSLPLFLSLLFYSLILHLHLPRSSHSPTPSHSLNPSLISSYLTISHSHHSVTHSLISLSHLTPLSHPTLSSHSSYPTFSSPLSPHSITLLSQLTISSHSTIQFFYHPSQPLSYPTCVSFLN